MCHAIEVQKQNRRNSHAHPAVPEVITVSSTGLTCQKVRRQILTHQVLASMKNLYGRACHPAVEMTAMERVQIVMRMA